MQHWFNYYSFLLVSVAIVGVLAAVMLRRDSGWRDYAVVGGTALLLFVIWLVVRPRQTVLSPDAAAVQAEIGAGVPVLLEFQSPYCLACTALKPTIDRLELEFAGRLRILRVNIQSEIGKELTAYYGFNYTPTFIFFDAEGNERWREVGDLDEARLRAELEP